LQQRYTLEAAETEKRMAEMFPSSRAKFSTFLERARQAVSDGEPSLAIHLYCRAIGQNRTSTNAMVELARTYEMSGDKGAAISTLEHAQDLRPDRRDITEMLQKLMAGQ
jgi:tetratricopeptide (TPR) repeat protein